MKTYTLIFTVILFLFVSCKKEEAKTEIPDSRTKIVNSSEINKKIKNGEDIAYRNATIIGNIDFTNSGDVSLITKNLMKSYVNSAVVFYDCTFKGKVFSFKRNKNFNTVTNFNKSISFINCTFQDTVDFTSSDFNGTVNFSNSFFQQFVSFKSAFFGIHGLIFTKTHFIKYSKFNMMHVFGNCNFSDAVFDENVLFQLSEFDNAVYFNAAKFQKNINFTKVKFNDDVFFNYAEFYKLLQFNTSVFRGRTEFVKSKFNMISEFKNCLFLSETKFSDAELKGILTFKNSVFYISDPENFNLNILNESDFILNNIQVSNKKVK